jgi:hypothetical protein
MACRVWVHEEFCGQEAHVVASYGNSEPIVMCYGHLLIMLERTRMDTDYQQQNWVITFDV